LEFISTLFYFMYRAKVFHGIACCVTHLYGWIGNWAFSEANVEDDNNCNGEGAAKHNPKSSFIGLCFS